MTLAQRLRKMIDGMPMDASVVLPVRSLEEWLKGVKDDGEDLTLEDLAAHYGKSLSTVRGWCQAGLFEGAYKLNGREWRVPQSALAKFTEHQQKETKRRREPRSRRAHKPVDIGAWRNTG